MSTNILITGRPRSGKTRLAMQRYQEMMREGLHVVLHDEHGVDIRSNRPTIPHTQADVSIICTATNGPLHETIQNVS